MRAGVNFKEPNQNQALMQRENAKTSILWIQSLPAFTSDFSTHFTAVCLTGCSCAKNTILCSSYACPSLSYVHTMSPTTVACLLPGPQACPGHTEIAILSNLVPSSYVIKKRYFVAFTQHM